MLWHCYNKIATVLCAVDTIKFGISFTYWTAKQVTLISHLIKFYNPMEFAIQLNSLLSNNSRLFSADYACACALFFQHTKCTRTRLDFTAPCVTRLKHTAKNLITRKRILRLRSGCYFLPTLVTKIKIKKCFSLNNNFT